MTSMISIYMAVGIAIASIFLGIGAGYALYTQFKRLREENIRQKRKLLEKEEKLTAAVETIEANQEKLQAIDKELKEKDQKLHQKDQKLDKLTKEKAQLTAKYHKKVKAAEVKKQNLAKYKQKKKEKRSLKKQIDDIIGKGEKWLPHSNHEPKSHKMGKPKGAKGGGRKRPETIHKTIDLYPNECPLCRIDLKDEKMFFGNDKVITDFVHDFDEFGCYKVPKIINIRQIRHRCKCPQCNRWIYPDLGLFKNARFGPGLVGYVIGQRIQFAMTYEDSINDMRKMFGGMFSLSQTAIIDWFYKFEEQIHDVYVQLEELITQEEFVHIDETGLPLLGENWWLWVLCSANLVLYRASSSRSHTSIEDIIKSFEGTIIADFFRAYEKFDNNPHQKCLAHLLSDIIELIVGLQKENERIAIKVKKHEEQIKRIADEKINEESGEKQKRGRKPKDAKLTKKELEQLEFKYQKNEKALEQATELGSFFKAPFKDTCFNWKKSKDKRISKEDAEQSLTTLLESIREQGIDEPDLEKIVKRCEKFMPQLFTYLQYEGMPPDNNQAERTLRKFARQRKVSGDFKSADLIKQYVSYLSLYMTCKANDRDFDRLLHDILIGKSVDLRMFLFDI